MKEAKVSALRSAMRAGFSVLIVSAACFALQPLTGLSLAPVTGAQAAESGHSGSQGGQGGHGASTTHGQGQGQGQGGASGRGQGSVGIGDVIFRGQGKHGSSEAQTSEEESDRPSWAGGGGKPGTGKPGTASTKKGDNYGDLWVVLRNPVTGAPILDENGNVQPILADGTVVKLTPEGDLPDEYSDQVQTVEFSRLNVSRAPNKVSDKSLQEAMDAIASADQITTDAAGRLVIIKDGEASTIDSPLENLALYVDAIKTGNFTLEQAAAFLGAASDKTQPVTLDVLVYLNTILGLNGTSGTNYVDYTHFTYDRSDVYSGDVTYLVANGDGTYTTEVKPIIEAVFHDEDVTKTGADAFAQAADDARAVIEFVHDNTIASE